MPAPPHPGGGGGPGKGPPLHRCCHPCTAGTALGLRSGCRGPTRRGPQEPKTAASGLRSLARTGEGGLGPGPMPRAPLPGRLEAGRPSKARSRLWVRPRVEDGELDDVVSSAIKRSRKPSRSPLRCVCVCAREQEQGTGALSPRPHQGGFHVHFGGCGSFPGFALARGPATPPPGGTRGNPGGSARHVSRKRAGRRRHEASRGPARPGEVGRNRSSWALAWQHRSLREAGPQEGPRGARRAARAPRCGPAHLPDSTCCPGTPGGGARVKSRRPWNDAPRRAAASSRPGTPERKPWWSQEQPQRAGEGLGRRHLGGTQQGPTV